MSFEHNNMELKNMSNVQEVSLCVCIKDLPSMPFEKWRYDIIKDLSKTSLFCHETFEPSAHNMEE